MRTPDDKEMLMGDEDMAFMDEVKEVITPAEAELQAKLDRFEGRVQGKPDEPPKPMEVTSELFLPKDSYTIAELMPTIDDVDPSEFDEADYCAEVDRRYREARRQGKSNSSAFWHHWSLAINKIWLQRCHENPDSITSMAAMLFWWNRDETLRLYIDQPLHKGARKKRLNKDAKDLRAVAEGRKRLSFNTTGYVKIATHFDKISRHYKQFFSALAHEEKRKTEMEAGDS